jgi:hypothetical protein
MFVAEIASKRQTVFISHVSCPYDNAFATWLAARLSLAGCEVWCDQKKLLGGEDFWNDIEKTLRNRAAKFALVISKNIRDAEGQLRDGVGKEIALANILKKSLPDPYFIVPILIDDTEFSDFSIEFIRLNGIDFKTNWASGFARLIDVLERDGVPRSESLFASSIDAWRTVHKSLARALTDEAEILQSNWLTIKSLPETLHFYEVLRPIEISEISSLASGCSLPCADHFRLLVAFAATKELQAALTEATPIKLRGSLKTVDFLAGKTGEIPGIAPSDARNKVSSLIRQAWDIKMAQLGLSSYVMANGQVAWWFPSGLPKDEQLHYVDLNGKPRRRAVIGVRGKRELPDKTLVPRYYWHLGFTGSPFIADESRIVLRPRLIITEDRSKPLENKTRLNAVRRGVTNMWFNEKWRGLVLGFASWLADNGAEIDLPAGGRARIVLTARPDEFEASVGIATDPVSRIPTDDEEETFEAQEEQVRLSDPAFAALEEELEG